MLERIAREVDAFVTLLAITAHQNPRPAGLRTGSMYVRLDKDVHATDAVELDLVIFVLPPVAHECHVLSVGLELLVACVSGLTKPYLVMINDLTFGEDGVFR